MCAYATRGGKRGRPKKGYTKGGKKRGRPPVSVKGIKRIVKATIARSLENKNRQYYNTGITIPPANSTLAFDSGIIPLSPRASFIQVDQGTGNGGRIGNTITTKRVHFKGTLTPQPYDVTVNPFPCPVQVKLFIFYDKRDPTNIPTPALNADFFQFNNSTQGFTNDLVDLWAPINNDCYRVLYSRCFKLGYSNNSGTGISAGNQSHTNNDFHLNCNFSINITKYLIKNVKYNDNNSIPTTRGLYAMFLPCLSDGTVTISTRRYAQLSFMIDYDYEDA